MAINYSSRNTPQVTHGTVDPIKLQANTKAPTRSQIGMGPRVPQEAMITNQIATPEVNPQGQQGSLEAPKSPSPAEDPLISSKFAALARKEKALRQRYAEFQSKEAELVKYREEAQQALAYRERLKSSPLDVLNEEGITYDQLVQRAVNPLNPEVTTLQAQVRALEESLKRQQEESQKSYQTNREQAEKQISMDVKNLISSDAAYETVKDMGAEEAVTQLIVSTYDEDGVLLTTDEAAKQVEAYLIEEATRIANTPSIKKRLQPAPTEALQQQAPQAIQKTPIKTLSNTMGAQSEIPAKTWEARKAQIVAKYSKKA